MIRPSVAIEELIAAAVARVELHNAQPFRTPISLAVTLEAKAAELISHYMRREIELLQAANRYLERARAAELKAKQSNVELVPSAFDMAMEAFWSECRGNEAGVRNAITAYLVATRAMTGG